MSSLVDTVLVLRILKKLTTPWEKTDAFKSGLIDNKGNILVGKADRTPQMKKAYTTLDRLIFNLKRVLQKLPGGGSQFGSYVAALALLKEHVEEESNKTTSTVLFEKMEDHNLVPAMKHDLSTKEGFLDAFEEEFMREMTVSGAGIGGALDGAQTNANTNASGLAAPNGPSKKKKGIEKVLNRRL